MEKWVLGLQFQRGCFPFVLCLIAKDIALLIVNDIHSCGESVSTAENTTLGVDLWVDIGCLSSIIELCVMWCWATTSVIFGQTSTTQSLAGGFFISLPNILLFGAALGVIQLAWIGFGFEIFSVLMTRKF